jgi:hypothetical protein
VSFPQSAANQQLIFEFAFRSFLEFSKTAAIGALSQCERGAIATPQRLYRNAKEALSRRDKASIAIPKGKNEEKMRFLSLCLLAFGPFLSLF